MLPNADCLDFVFGISSQSADTLHLAVSLSWYCHLLIKCLIYYLSGWLWKISTQTKPGSAGGNFMLPEGGSSPLLPHAYSGSAQLLWWIWLYCIIIRINLVRKKWYIQVYNEKGALELLLIYQSNLDINKWEKKSMIRYKLVKIKTLLKIKQKCV